MKYLVLIVFGWIILGCHDNQTTELNRRIKMVAERAYFEGQRDALKGDVRINPDSPYSWIRSPWADQRPIDYKLDTISTRLTHLFY